MNLREGLSHCLSSFCSLFRLQKSEWRKPGPKGHAQILRNYSYDMNGNQVYQRIGKSKSSCDYMRSNLPKHIYGKRDTTASAYSDLYYEYNNHDDRIYKKVQNSNGSSASAYYLRDASGKELAEWDMINNSWVYYAYGRERVAQLQGSNDIVYYAYDHLGSLRVAYDASGDCLGSVTYKLNAMSDYYAYGKTLRSFGGDKYGYQGSEKNKELGDHDYYTHFRGLDVDVARWKGVDPVYHAYESPYASMGNNPVMFNDVLGNDPHEYEIDVKTGKKTKVSDLGGDVVDFNHHVGGKKNGRTEIVNKKTGDSQWMNSSKNIKGYTKRDNDVDWVDLYTEYKTGLGPEKSLMDQNHPMSKDIFRSLDFLSAYSDFKKSGLGKFAAKPFFEPFTPGDNMTMQFVGKAVYNFYQVGDKLVAIIIDSKSISSESLNPFNKGEERNIPRVNGQIIPESNTHQTYLLILDTPKK